MMTALTNLDGYEVSKGLTFPQVVSIADVNADGKFTTTTCKRF